MYLCTVFIGLYLMSVSLLSLMLNLNDNKVAYLLNKLIKLICQNTKGHTFCSYVAMSI